MAAAKHQRGVEAVAFGCGVTLKPAALQRAEMRPEALHQVQVGVEAFGQAEARLGAEKQDARALAAAAAATPASKG